MLQLLPAASEEPHVLASVKSAALVPLSEMLVMLKAALPVLVTLTVCDELVSPTGSLPNDKLVVERLTLPLPLEDPPVPVRATLWGLPVALSVTVTSAYRDPAAVGEKTTAIVQVAPFASELPHVLVSLKSLMLTPVMAMREMLKAELPEFRSVRA
jgi:hypothetical protein